MYVIRGRGETPSADLDVTKHLVAETVERNAPSVRVWTPHRIVAFGRRDANRRGYERARSIAASHGFQPVERTVGGHAAALTGNTVAFVQVTPSDEPRTGIQDRYEATKSVLDTALSEFGVDLESGEPPHSFCPGCHSLSADGKVVGLAQRVHRTVAVVSGIVIVRDHDEIAAVLKPIYEALGIEFDPGSVGSIRRAGGPDESASVVDAIEDALTAEAARIDTATVETVRET